MIRKLLIVGILALAGCASYSSSPAAGPKEGADYLLVTEDQPGPERWDVAITSLANRPICVASEDWPNETGRIHFGAERVAIRIDQMSYPTEDWNMGYCFGGCGETKVAPGATVRSRMPYERFPTMDRSLFRRDKTLDFKIATYWCRR
jgi:hypothetical protein